MHRMKMGDITILTTVHPLGRVITCCLFICLTIESAWCQQGSVAWSRPTAGSASLFRPAISPAGDVLTTNGGVVTSFSRSGELLWSVDVNGALGPVSVGADGTVYANVGHVGANPTILALNPDGSEKWTFDAGASIHAGPNIGPDGNIYAVADTQFGGRGFFALNPNGELLWDHVGEPPLSADTGQPHEIIFGNDRAYVAMATQGAGGGGGQPAGLWAFDFAGNQVFALTESCQGQPVVSPLTDNLVTGNGICQAVQTYNANNGQLLWSVDAPSQSPCSGMANIAVGPDGCIYTAFCYRAFWSLTAEGDERWFDDNFNFYFQMDRLAVTPDNRFVLDLGGDVGQPGWVRAFSTDVGILQWQIDLDMPQQKAVSRPAFDAVGNRFYFNVNRFGLDSSDLFAVDLILVGDLNGDGTVDLLDVAPFIAAISSGVFDPAADINGDGIVNLLDVMPFIDLLVGG